MTPQTPDDLIYAAYFFVDIVGLSNPKLSTETQRTKIKILNETIYSCKSFSEIPKDRLLILPTGDGMLIGFKAGLEEPLKLAIEFQKKLAKYNENATDVEKIETRIGCNIGHVFVVEDIYGHINLWGPGAIHARRIMDMGDTNHILVSSELRNDLIDLSKDYESQLHLLQNFGIKHGGDLLVYSAYGDDFGNPEPPKEKLKVNKKALSTEKNSICEKMIFNIALKDDSAHVERQFYFSNSSSEPIYEIVAGVVTNSEEEFPSLNLKAYDGHKHELEISQILSSTPFSKKIVIKLEKPIFSGDKDRLVKLVYDLKLSRNNFENFFLIDTSVFELNLSHYSELDISPKLYYIDNENGNKTILFESSNIAKGISRTIHWEKTEGINLKDMIRLEW